VRIRTLKGVRRGQDSESGQATTEFALILLPLLLLVSGIIWFGIGLNFWLDMQRIANQGARWAVVNCGPASQAAVVCNPSLAGYLESQPLSRGNDPDVRVCYETKSGNSSGSPSPIAGDAVTVQLRVRDFELVPLLGISKDLRASATMRMEQVPTNGGLATAPLCSTPWP
jgi:TadE-like protein